MKWRLAGKISVQNAASWIFGVGMWMNMYYWTGTDNTEMNSLLPGEIKYFCSLESG